MIFKRRKWVGALIGFALGLYVASTVFITFFSEYSFVTNFDKGIVIFIYLLVVGAFSFFGVYCMSDTVYSIKIGRNERVKTNPNK